MHKLVQMQNGTLVNPVPTRGWDTGKQYGTPEGYVSGMRVRGQDNLYMWLRELSRCIDVGIRGFLIPDEGLLYLANKLREDGVILRMSNLKFLYLLVTAMLLTLKC